MPTRSVSRVGDCTANSVPVVGAGCCGTALRVASWLQICKDGISGSYKYVSGS